MQVIIISGLAGSGKKTALNILEDKGYTSIDNLPPKMLELVIHDSITSNKTRLAIGVMILDQTDLNQLLSTLKSNLLEQVQLNLIYLEARVEVLVRRFSETRRKHPFLSSSNKLSQCIEEERLMLRPLRDISNKIDTSDLTPNALRHFIKNFIALSPTKLNIVLQSFGFKYALPLDSDYVFDVRFLPNPYYDPKLRDLTGSEQQIIDFLAKSSQVQKMLLDLFNFLNSWLPSFEQDNRSYVTISIGCTGGRHRSVYLVNHLAELFKAQNYFVLTQHRELHKANITI